MQLEYLIYTFQLPRPSMRATLPSHSINIKIRYITTLYFSENGDTSC